MEVRKTNRVILESDALKSPGFSTNNSITSLILNEDQNQLESELSFLEDESELQSLSPQPQPDLLIDLADLTSAIGVDLDGDAIRANPMDEILVDVIANLEPSVGGDDPFDISGHLARSNGDNDAHSELDDADDPIDTNVNLKEQKSKEMTIMEQSSSSTSSSTASIVSSVVTSSSTTSKSSAKAVNAKEITTDGTVAKTTTKTATSSTSSVEATIVAENNKEPSAPTSPVPNSNVNELPSPSKTSSSGSNKKKNKNNKTSSESISVSRHWINTINQKPTTPRANSTNRENPRHPSVNCSSAVKDDVFSRVSVSFLRRSFDGDLNFLADPNPTSTSSSNGEGSNNLEQADEDEGVCPTPTADDKVAVNSSSERWNTVGDSSKSQNGAPIVFIPGDDFSGVSVNKLKSSFTKFDNLAKKELKAVGVLNHRNKDEQEKTTAVSAPQPNHVCNACKQEVFQMELIRAGKGDYHKNCFRCTVCNKTQSLDSYSSHEGNVYCKPHFKELFQPKAVIQTEEEIAEKIKKKVEVIIRESEPVPLPPDVVRASEKSGLDIQDLKLDVKSKFELFENLSTGGAEEKDNRSEEISEELKKTGSVQSRLAKYQSRVAASTAPMEVTGVTDEDLGGLGPRRHIREDGTVEEEGESSGDEVLDPRYLRKVLPVDEINGVAIDEVRNKWEVGINSKKEEISEARREEQSRFRTRLLMGKNTQMKDMYEKACEDGTPEKEQSLQSADLEVMKTSEKKARDLKELFEKGEPLTPQSESLKLEKEVFESEIAKNSRSLFKEMDKCVAAGTPMSISPVSRQGQIKRQESNSIKKRDVPDGVEVVKSSDTNNEIIAPEDISSKFKFFETFEEKLSENKSKEKFRMTPPRDLGEKESSPPVEIYRDPNIVRSDASAEPDIPVTRTASKMLSVFRQLEQEQNESGDAKKSFKPLKEFTPPRETLKTTNGHDNDNESGDSQDGDDSGEEDAIDDDGAESKPGDMEKDELLKQVGSLARATSLRLKFERWERDENAKNKDHGFDSLMDEEQDNLASIESTKNLRAKFEHYNDNVVEQEKMQKIRRGESLKVKRFVELTNNSGTNMENCAACEKRVYVMEKVEAGGKVYHKTCFRCSLPSCRALLRMDTFTSNKGVLFCTPHFKQLFKIKGNYDEGFGHETHRQAFEKKKRAAEAGNAEEKEN